MDGLKEPAHTVPLSDDNTDSQGVSLKGNEVAKIAKAGKEAGGVSNAAKSQVAGIEERDADADSDPQEENGSNALSLSRLGAAVEEIDDNIDDALGNAADSIWSFATSMTGKVTRVVKEGDFENLRKNVSSHLRPLDDIGRDLSTHMSAYAPNEEALANFTGSVKSVAATVQRNAQAMEAAILAKANMVESDEGDVGEVERAALQTDGAAIVAMSDPATGLLPLTADRGQVDPEDAMDVNEEIAKVGETITNSIVGQTVGDLWTGLWGQAPGQEEGDHVDAREGVPKTRFEKRIFTLEADPDTYCEPAKDLDAFEQWSKSFVLDDFADRCIAILDRHASIAELYERVVPKIVEEDTFWMRLFFAKNVLENEEERRKKLLERAENTVAEGDDEDGWGDDDWDDDTQVQTEQNVSDEKGAGGVGESSVPSVSQENLQKGGAEEAGPKTGPQEKKPSTEKADEYKAAASKPTTTLEVISTPDDDWGEDDWE